MHTNKQAGGLRPHTWDRLSTLASLNISHQHINYTNTVTIKNTNANIEIHKYKERQDKNTNFQLQKREVRLETAEGISSHSWRRLPSRIYKITPEHLANTQKHNKYRKCTTTKAIYKITSFIIASCKHTNTQQIHKYRSVHKYKMTSHNKLSHREHLSHWCRCGVDFLGRSHKIGEGCK